MTCMVSAHEVKLGLNWMSCHRVRQVPLEAMPFKSYIIPSCVSTRGSADRFCAAAVPFEGLNDAAAAAAVELDSSELVMVLLAGTSIGAGSDS